MRARKPACHLPLLRCPIILHGTCTNGPTLGKGTFTMASEKKVRVAIVGLGFGAEFIPIYQAHPNAEIYAVCRRNKSELDKCADKFKIPQRYTSYEDLLKDPNVDAVHINSPIPDHGPQSLA